MVIQLLVIIIFVFKLIEFILVFCLFCKDNIRNITGKINNFLVSWLEELYFEFINNDNEIILIEFVIYKRHNAYK